MYFQIGNDLLRKHILTYENNFPLLTLRVVIKNNSIQLEMEYEEWKKEFMSVIFSLLEISSNIPRVKMYFYYYFILSAIVKYLTHLF